MHRGRLYRGTSALLLALLLITTTSCGNVDDFMDEAGDVLKDVGDVAKDVGEVVKDAIDEHGSESASSGESGGQTVSRPPRPTGTLSTGTETPLVTETVSPSGGTVTVDKQGDPLNGLEIRVPAGAFSDSRQFAVSSAPVSGHTFGEYFSPATPLITIENGGDYSDELMTVRIPVDVPPDHFAMAFYYDETAGTLEGIPFTAMDDQSITIVTRHFCSLLVSIINNTLLDDLLKGDIDSHFRPGIDDWQFTNYGSYIVKKGHCAGQSITAMWYYCEQPDGADLTLHGRYDNNGRQPATPGFWQDDSYGLRLASVVQDDIDWDSFGVQFQMELRGKDDLAHYKAFAYSIALTGEPQYVGLASSAGGGHAMVVYRVYKDILYVADPNFPGNTERRIELVKGKFEPYNSGENAAEIAAGHTTNYESIGYRAKTSMVDWAQVSAHWNELKAGIIGNGRFPVYNLYVLTDEGGINPFVDGYVSEQKDIDISLMIGTIANGKVNVYRDGALVDRDANGQFELEEGNNRLGVLITGNVTDYIDFQYYNVQYGEEEECHGWVLDSVTHEDEAFPFYPPTQQDYVWETNDGSYSASGRMPMSTIEDPDPIATFTASGTWSPPPSCIDPTKPVPFTARLVTTVQFDQPYQMQAGGFFNTIWVHVNSVGTSEIWMHHEANSASPVLDETRTWDMWLNENPENIADATQVVIVQISSDTGASEYRYHYVWRE